MHIIRHIIEVKCMDTMGIFGCQCNTVTTVVLVSSQANPLHHILTVYA